jgi:sigma-E factor negative regulatory protein RseA
MMNERLRESLSALMDNEADELEIERVLARVGEDGELRSAWLRYNLVRNSLQGHPLAHLDWDISQQVRAAVATATGGAGFRQRFLRPLTSLAVAASVAATVVLGGQQLIQISGGDSRDLPVDPFPVSSSYGYTEGTAVRASYGMQELPGLQPVTRNAYNELAQQRSRRFMQAHAEQAALNSPNGLLPFARVQEIRE